MLSALPSNWDIIVIDIKDCFFFSIPLCLQDTIRFAFTLPSCNHEEPDQHYEWVVLPQGMANSPTMCQLYVTQALEPVRAAHPHIKCVHYMDDILLTGKDIVLLENAFIAMIKALEAWGLHITPEKVQWTNIVQYLGAHISPNAV